MSISFRKAGETALKKVALGTKPLRPPRALSAAEAPEYLPHNTASKHTVMPWKGWFQRWLHEKIGDEKFAKFRSTFFFWPNDIYDLEQAPRLSKAIPISKTDPTITHKYRTPCPGSQKIARLPEFEEGEDPYDTGYFKKDTRRRYLSSELNDPDVEKLKLTLMGADSELVKEELSKLEAGPTSSQGNKGVFATGPTKFDPTGLRSTMSVSWKELEKSLDANMPDHLPTPTWVGHEKEIIAWHEERNLPVTVGAYYQDLKVPVERRVARW